MLTIDPACCLRLKHVGMRSLGKLFGINYMASTFGAGLGADGQKVSYDTEPNTMGKGPKAVNIELL